MFTAGAFYDKNINVRTYCKPLSFPSKFNMSAQAKSIISGMLDKNLESRLGSGEADRWVKTTVLFGVDWEQLGVTGVKPPFRPSVKGDTDIQNLTRWALDAARGGFCAMSLPANTCFC